MLARPVVVAWTKQTLTDHFFKEAKVCQRCTIYSHGSQRMLQQQQQTAAAT
jgi:hypothetical protein